MLFLSVGETESSLKSILLAIQRLSLSSLPLTYVRHMYDLCAIGNALVDIIVKADDAFLDQNGIVKGAMTLVDEQTSAILYEKAGAAVELSSGGSAGNTAAGAAMLGLACAYQGKVGCDEFGGVFSHDLRAQNIHFPSRPSDGLCTGHCLVFVTPDSQRSMLTHLGAATEFGLDDLSADAIRASGITYLEGYLFDKPSAQNALLEASRIAHAAGRKTAATLSDVFCITRHRAAFLDLIRKEIDIVFANQNEALALYETADICGALDHLRQDAGIAVVTRSEKGALIAKGSETLDIPAQAVQVVDSTGAGDLFAAGFLYGLARGKSLAECGRLGVVAASEVISHYGPRPQIDLKNLL